MKKYIALLLAMLTLLVTITGCNNTPASTPESHTSEAGTPESHAPEVGAKINVISREDGSGTRSAFVELFGVLDENKNDLTLDAAEITNNTSVMMTTVAGDPSAIGYISLGSLNDAVKALKIDGVAPSTEAVKDGSYTISRPFNIATAGELTPVTQNFIDFILSNEGQAVVDAKGYIRMDNTAPFGGIKGEGKIVVAGSSSVTPVMEALTEAYQALNTGANIEIQQSDSTTGMNAAIEGICDIGMASRALKDSELDKGLSETLIAIDGIAVIVHKDNAVDNLTKEQVKDIYTGSLTVWSAQS